LRGIGFYESSLSTAPAVSVYMDEVPLPLPILSTHAAFDLERIEVLKGPQGTLFGQNSTGGALNYVAAKPGDELEAGFDLSYGRFDAVELNGYLSGGLTETLSSRIALHALSSSGWQEGRSRDDTNGEADVFAVRMITEFAPIDSLRLSLNLNGWRDQSDPLAPQYNAPFPQQPCCAFPEVLAVPPSEDEARQADWSENSRPEADNELMQAALRTDFDITDSITLTSLTSFIDFDLEQVPEGDGTTFNILDVRSHDGSIESFTQELRVANSGDTQLRWVIGANYDDITAEETFINDFTDSSTAPALGIYTAGVYGKQ
jgi:outer membrane receptor protein involved in Fe transport